MGKKRPNYKKNRAPAAKTWKERWEVYKRWYAHYAKNNEMTQEGVLNLGAYKATVLRKKYRGEEMNNISRRVAMEQRLASETQLKVTWETIKREIPEFKKNIKLGRESIEREELARFVTGRKNLSMDQIDRAVLKWGDQPLPKAVIRATKERVAAEFEKEINFLETYLPKKKKGDKEVDFLEKFGDIKFTDFRKKQKDIVNAARSIVTSKDGREEWNARFAEAVSYVYRQ